MTKQHHRMREVGDLELNKETLADLAELQAEQAGGGRISEEVPANVGGVRLAGGKVSGITWPWAPTE